MSDARTARADTIRGLSIPQEMLPGTVASVPVRPASATLRWKP